MLMEFTTKNYKSFKNKMVFTMVPAPKQKGLDYSILNKKIGSKVYKGLCSAVIYGPNASGKTNIIGAMEVLKGIVLRGHIRNSNAQKTPNAAVDFLELIPNCASNVKESVDFSIKFIEDGILFEYELSIDIGNFLEAECDRKILMEALSVNERLIFKRSSSLEFGDMKAIKKYLVNEFEDNEEGAKTLAKGNLNDEELFLTNGFKAMFSARLVNIISNWFKNKFIVIYRADALHLVRKISKPKKHTIYREEVIDRAVKAFGVNTSELGYFISQDDSKALLCSILDDKPIPAELFESHGTIRFANMFPLILDAIAIGGTLVVDEFDASLHPMALMSIVNIFHNDDINTKNAQLIFNTHNPIFLNPNLFRRDEIKFVECDDPTQGSIHYSLSDFGTSGEKGVRREDDYMKYYFVSQYGAIKEVDFTPIFEELLNEGKEI